MHVCIYVRVYVSDALHFVMKIFWSHDKMREFSAILHQLLQATKVIKGIKCILH